MTDKETLQALQDYHEYMVKDHAELEKYNASILEEVRNICTIEAYKDIIEYLPEIEGAGRMKISDSPKGTFQEESFEVLIGVYVDQSCAAWAEDAYYGTISIPLGNGKFLEIPYSC